MLPVVTVSTKLRWVIVWACLSGVGCTGDTPFLSVGDSADESGTPKITITSIGVSPKMLTVTQGQRVLFVNNDTVAHEMASDFHPTHDRWPVLNQVGYLAPGQSRETGNLNSVGLVTYHDHLDAENENLLGAIRIVALD